MRSVSAGLLCAAVLASACLVGACKTAVDSRAIYRPKHIAADPEFPHGYATSPQWTKLSTEAIYRSDVKTVRELYGKVKPGLGVGTILVKEEYSFEPGKPREMIVIGVMRRTGAAEDADTGGWSFAAFDPKSKSRYGQDTAACIGCHLLQKDDDWVFAVGTELPY